MSIEDKSTWIRIDQLRMPLHHLPEDVIKKAEKILGIQNRTDAVIRIVRRSIDARKKPDISFVYTVDVRIPAGTRVKKSPHAREIHPVVYDPFRWTNTSGTDGQKTVADGKRRAEMADEPHRRLRIAVVGSGPAGLFAAYLLALNGWCPVLLERGKPAKERLADVERFWKEGILSDGSNVQFGEGGAGTFSDGKLNTGVRDREGRNRFVLETFVRFGAPEEILYDAAPHLGTDRLVPMVTEMREEIRRLGGEVRFQTQVTGILTGSGRIRGLMLNETETLPVDACILAIGHSARDTFRMLHEKNIPMEAKSFAVGFRVEHPQEMITKAQYGEEYDPKLPPAAYKLTFRSSLGRSVYTFCMCPGGYVVNASSGGEQCVVNGMSYSGRGSANANSAVVVSVGAEDFGEDGSVLAGLAFQERLERAAFLAGGGRIPQQQFGAFEKDLGISEAEKTNPDSEKRTKTTERFLSCVKGKTTEASLAGILPPAAELSLAEGIHAFGRKIRGFDRPDAILSAVESRTSSPVRILRNQSCESSIRGLFPCGEGAGYAGGITSAAMDGLKCAEACMEKLNNR